MKSEDRMKQKGVTSDIITGKRSNLFARRAVARRGDSEGTLTNNLKKNRTHQRVTENAAKNRMRGWSAKGTLDAGGTGSRSRVVFLVQWRQLMDGGIGTVTHILPRQRSRFNADGFSVMKINFM